MKKSHFTPFTVKVFKVTTPGGETHKICIKDKKVFTTPVELAPMREMNGKECAAYCKRMRYVLIEIGDELVE